MKTIISGIQKNFTQIQKKLKEEGETLVDELKAIANEDTVGAKKKALEKLFQKKIKNVEPALDTLIRELRASASDALHEVARKVSPDAPKRPIRKPAKASPRGGRKSK